MPPEPDGKSSTPRWAAPCALILLGAVLYLPGIQWGLPAVVSWSQDTIAGVRTLGAMETWPERFMGRYPPWHYMVLRAAYEPVLRHWRDSGQIQVDAQTGDWQLAPPHAPKVGLLLLIARVISAVLAIGAGLVLLLAARQATGDWLAGFLAGAAFMSGAAFTYFAHLGNVDVPSVFWLSLSLLFYLRALSTRSLPDTGLLGFFAALTTCTKDGWAGIYPGMAIVLLVAEWRSPMLAGSARESHALKGTPGQPATAGALLSLTRAVMQPRWLVGLFAFAVPYLVINAIPWNAQAYADRLGGWLSPAEGSWITREYRHGSVSLAVETIRQAAAGVGWPMLLAVFASTIYSVIHRPLLALALLTPILSYYLIVIERINFVYERFLFAPVMLLSVLLGFAAAELVRSRRIPVLVRLGVPTAILLSTLGYSATIVLEMRSDSRYAAEEWFQQHVPLTASVGAVTEDLKFFVPQYLPRLHELGYATYPVICRVAEFERPQPDYLILSSFDQQDFDTDAAQCATELLAGRLGYQQVATFGPSYLDTDFFLGAAGWGAPVPGKISPRLTVLRRAGH